MVKIKDINLEKFMEEVIEEEIKLADNAIIEAQEEVGEEIVQELKDTSPSGNRKSKKYKNSWKYKVEKGRLVSSLRIYNEQAGLTHLLEYGHVVANQHGKYTKRAKSQPHIAPAEEKAKKLIVDKIQNKL